MRVAHLADPHLGFRQYHRQTATGINQREADVANAFREAITGVIDARPDVVLIAGDLFHSVRPTNAAIVFAYQQFHRLRSSLPEVPVILIAGNHDTPRSVETGSILQLFTGLGVDVVASEAQHLHYPALDLSVLAVPHQALLTEPRTLLAPEGDARHRILLIHGDVAGVLPAHGAAEYGGAMIPPGELQDGDWSYVALGHYHVQRAVGERSWYAGSLEYVSTNPWGERQEEQRAAHGAGGKGWLLVELPAGNVVPQALAGTRTLLDLAPIEGAGLDAADIDRHIQERLSAVAGGLDGKLIRLVVRDVPRHVARALNHAAIREAKAAALHFHLDVRRPEPARTAASGAPGRRRTLPQLVRTHLEGRPLPAVIDRAEFVSTGVKLIDEAERDLSED